MASQAYLRVGSANGVRIIFEMVLGIMPRTATVATRSVQQVGDKVNREADLLAHQVLRRLDDQAR